MFLTGSKDDANRTKDTVNRTICWYVALEKAKSRPGREDADWAGPGDEAISGWARHETNRRVTPSLVPTARAPREKVGSGGG